MKKWFFLLATGLAVIAGGYFVARSEGVGHVLDDGSIELLPPTTIISPASSSTTGTGYVALFPRGNAIRVNRKFVGAVHVAAAPGNANANLDVWFQTSADEGATWQDLCHMSIPSTAPTPATYLMPSTCALDYCGNIPYTPYAFDLAANTIVAQSKGLGSRFRVGYSASFNAGAINSWAFHATFKPD